MDRAATERMRSRHNELEMADFSEPVLKVLKGIKISSTHCWRTFTLRDIDTELCSASMFPWVDADGNETAMSVAAFARAAAVA